MDINITVKKSDVVWNLFKYLDKYWFGKIPELNPLRTEGDTDLEFIINKLLLKPEVLIL